MKKLFTLFFSLASIIGLAQIPNEDFQNWTDMGDYNTPDDWANLNALTDPMSVYTCVKGTLSGNNSYIKLVSKSVTGMGVVPGVTTCGELDLTTMSAISGIPYTERPESFKGKWQHMIFGTSQGFIDVRLTKWNTTTQTQDLIASKHLTLVDMAMSWANFTLTLNYASDEYPDSCRITMSASGNNPTNNDYLYIDDVFFFGGTIGVSETVESVSDIMIYPNPSSNVIQVSCGSKRNENVSLNILDMQGNMISRSNKILVTGKNNFSQDISILSRGVYLLQIITHDMIETRKLIVE